MRHDQERIEGYPVLFWKEYVKLSPILAFRAVCLRSMHTTQASVDSTSSGGVRLVTKQTLAVTSRYYLVCSISIFTH
jgi:hypothetical protein